MRLTLALLTGLCLGATSTLPWHWRERAELAECRADAALAGAEMDQAARMLRRVGGELRAHGAIIEATARQCRR